MQTHLAIQMSTHNICFYKEVGSANLLVTRDELRKANVTERFVALRNATVRYQKALRSAL